MIMRLCHALLSCLLLGSAQTVADAFLFPKSTPTFFQRAVRQDTLLSRCRCILSLSTANDKVVLVISPPGGVGQVAAVKAAEMGASVQWLVITSADAVAITASTTATALAQNPQQQQQLQQVILSQEAMDQIVQAGGSIALTGADANNLLRPTSDPQSALTAVQQWCRDTSADALICTYDDGSGLLQPDAARSTPGTKKKASDREKEQNVLHNWKNAIRVAAKEAATAGNVQGTRIAILSASDQETALFSANDDNDHDKDSRGQDESGIGGLMGQLLGGSKSVDVPDSLEDALRSSSSSGMFVTLRFGQLFGLPESCPDFSPLVGGPRRDPELCEEYTMRTVRVDPTLSVTGNRILSSTTRTSRHAVGEAAVYMALSRVPLAPSLDVCVTSQTGTEPLSVDDWIQEFERVQKILAQTSGISSAAGVQIFTAEFGSVPDKARLADWLATKWAPAVLRTYDLAGIRTGARPVYASRALSVDSNDDEMDRSGSVEIYWQQLVNFESVVAGKMVITVTDQGLAAFRASGDASKGFGTVSRKPLPGEDVLVRRLAEAASQAMEKGLASKPKSRKVSEAVLPVASPPQPVVSSMPPLPPPVVAVTGTSETDGPRQSGARRSRERERGSKRAPAGSTTQPPTTTSTE